MSLTGQIAVFLAATVIVVPLFRRFRLSAVLGYLAAGVVIGPWGLALFRDVDNVLHFAEFGVVLLLFVIGLELQPSRLWVMRRSVFGAGLAQVLLTTAVLAGSSRAFIDLDRFVPETLALHPKGGVEVSAGRIFFYRGEIGTPIFIPLDGGDGDFIFDTAHEFEVRVGPGIGGGGRLSLFADAGHAGDPGDHFQSAIEPYFVYEPFGRKGFFVRAGILLALDRPLGFAFDRNGLAAFRVAAGGKF